jgi:hypothetical protein
MSHVDFGETLLNLSDSTGLLRGAASRVRPVPDCAESSGIADIGTDTMTLAEMRRCYNPSFQLKEEALRFAARRLRERAELYAPLAGGYGPLSTFWGWRTIGSELRKIADEMEGLGNNIEELS